MFTYICRQSLDTCNSARCKDLVVTSSKVAGKLVRPGSETNQRVGVEEDRSSSIHKPVGEAAHVGGGVAALYTSGQRPWGTGQSPSVRAGGCQ